MSIYLDIYMYLIYTYTSNPEWLLDLDTDPEWLADVEIEDEESEEEEEDEDEEEEDGSEVQAELDLDEDDREFFEARGVFKDKASAKARSTPVEGDGIERVVIATGSRVEGAGVRSFRKLGVTQEALLERIEALGFEQPTEIQEATVPQVRSVLLALRVQQNGF